VTAERCGNGKRKEDQSLDERVMHAAHFAPPPERTVV
jgi:hypothetical protein